MGKKKKKAAAEKRTAEKGILYQSRGITPVAVTLIAVAVIISYSNSFSCSFHYDDVHHIFQNRHIKTLASFTDPGFWFSFYNRAPAQLTLCINYMLSGYNAGSYHIFNLIIHVLSSLAVYFLVSFFTGKVFYKEDDSLRRKFIPLMTAFVFAVHPVQTESVTYIVQRMESLAGLFYITALIFYYLFRTSLKSTGTKILYAAAFIIMSVLAVLTKQTSFSLPLAVVLIEIFFITDKDGSFNKKVVYGLSGLMGISLAAGLILNILPKEVNAEFSRYDYFLAQMEVIPRYIRIMLLPYGQNFDHYIKIPSGLTDPYVVSGILLILIMLISAAVLYKRGFKLLSFSIFWFFAVISLRSSILPISDLMAEHRLYTAVLGYGLFLSVLVLYAGEYLYKRSGSMVPLAVIPLAVLTALSSVTYSRNEVWKNDLTLWKDTVRKSPDKFRPLYNYAKALNDTGQPKSALEYYLKALRVNDRSWGLYNNMGNIYSGAGELKAAKLCYEKAVELKPDYSKAKNNLANIYFKEGDREKAESLYLEIIKANPKDLNPYLNLGHLYYMSGKFEKAAEFYRRVLMIDPSNEQARSNLNVLENTRLK